MADAKRAARRRAEREANRPCNRPEVVAAYEAANERFARHFASVEREWGPALEHLDA